MLWCATGAARNNVRGMQLIGRGAHCFFDRKSHPRGGGFGSPPLLLRPFLAYT
jgi:hypothetical protein